MFVVIMFVDSSTTRLNGKAYPRHLLRESLSRGRQGQAPHDRQPLPLQGGGSGGDPARAPAQGGPGRDGRGGGREGAGVGQGSSVGAVWLLSQLARDPGIAAALGSDRQGKLALWQVIARVLDQGSRLSAVRLAGGHAAGAALGMISFDEDDLYANLDWLAQHQADIETRLFAQRKLASAPDVFLYDVTSTCLEGEQNAFAAFGYNRDRKSGKRQIVIGLLCDADGRPLSIQLFAGNTSDVKTFSLAAEQGGGAFRRPTGDFRRRPRHDQLPATRRTGRRRFPLHHRHHQGADRRLDRGGRAADGLVRRDPVGRRQGRRALCAATQSGPRRGIGGLAAG